MREILFRAKRKDNGEWTEGYVFELQPGQYMICDRIQYDRPSTLSVWEFFRYCTHEIVPETLCQYTGLTDKNGKRIWENDIVQTPFRRFVVTYFDGVWGDRDGVAMRESIFGEGGVVIRNVFDNPELME